MATVLARPVAPDRPTQRYDLIGVAHARLVFLLLIFALLTSVLAGRMLWMGIAAGAGDTGRSGLAMVPPRADILDRNGEPLARTIDAYSIAVRPERVIGDRQDLADKLHEIFPDTSAGTFFRLLQPTKRWAYLRRRALPEQVAAVNALGEVGIEFPREKERLYPQRSLAAHALGFTSVDGTGGMGVERAFNDRLTDAATRGTPLVLSLDARVQAVMEAELYQGLTAQQARAAAGVILDANTGEVIAMASMPVFDPNKLNNQSMDARRNDIVQSAYELGSTFKPLAFAAAMDAGVVTSMSKRYDATAPLSVGGFRIHDDHSAGRWLNVPEALVHSSNIVTARIADELGTDRLQAMYRKLGFHERSAIELRERAGTIWPSNWGRLTTMTTAYGHGIAVTPMHLASAYAALVNGGVMRPATMLKLREGQVPDGVRVFSSATSARMRQLLRLIVLDGTGRSADAKGYRVGGKTGSAEKPHAGGYAKHSLVTTFAAAFPMDNPRYVVLVMMDEPKGNAETFGLRTAAWTAAPIVRRVIERAAPMMGVYPEASRDVDVSELTPLLWKAKGEE
ncbi:penicillin-binding protein 2 [Sphingobium sufflavum]|uniref:peptidoglycan D,D-transpeptidase FtsI family protein n=1 Tax=Sphingobium sufflavum TaxID=1129547 RepID=UPI001F2A6CFC|nr:penicillin-binding protein 2 [Sphingobium sufflavum]MCE7795870.1 penicillin-binding protein 2 [Sphingobium sufflavum]